MASGDGCDNQLVQGRLGLFQYGIKTGGIGDRDFAEHLAVQLDMGLLATIDKLAVTITPLSTGRAETHDPEAAKIAFTQLATDPGIHAGAYACLLGQTEQTPGGATVSLDGFEKSLVGLTPCGA